MILIVKLCKSKTQENRQELNSIELMSRVAESPANSSQAHADLDNAFSQVNQTNLETYNVKINDQLSTADLPTYEEYIKKINSNAN